MHKVDTDLKRKLVKQLIEDYGNFNLKRDEIELLKIAAEVMDGGIRIAKGNDYENHPIYSYDIFGGMKGFPERAARLILEHHERFDGSGYPYGITGDKMDSLSHILTLIDEYIDIRMFHSKKETFARLRDNESFHGATLRRFLNFLIEYDEPGVLGIAN